jgi:glyoxylase-like metal-dependent hydrolase (beta-lactamase superfamily II)
MYTGPGTNTYVVTAGGEVAIIDPGPMLEEHLRAVEAAAAAGRVVAILVTHTHPDHAPAANPLGERLGAPVYGFGPGPDFEPTHTLVDGATVAVGGTALVAVHTPGHTADHLCYRTGDLLFTGDHIMGGSTVVIEDAAEYLDSLHKVAALGVGVIFPGHGPALEDASAAIADYIAHRKMREDQILASLRDGAATVGDLVRDIYVDVDPELHPAAAHQVVVQLQKLAAEGRVSLPPGGAGLDTQVSVSEGTGS